jgi:hypothetical protein
MISGWIAMAFGDRDDDSTLRSVEEHDPSRER